MDMIPPALKDAAASPVNDLEQESKYPAAASMGTRIGSRLSVKRRLFSDETPENSPPITWSAKEKLAEIFAAEKERALRKWGFDIDSDSPSTSLSSQFEWKVSKATDVPKYYRRGYSSNFDATFSPKKRYRFEQTPLPKSSSSTWSKPEKSQITTSAPDSSSADACFLTGSISGAGASSKHLNETPVRRPEKNTNAKRITAISRQARLTDFYSQKRRGSTGASPIKSRKRFAVDVTDSSHVDTDTSSAVLP